MFLSHERKVLAAKGAGVALFLGVGFGLFIRPDLDSGRFQLGSRSEFGFARPAASSPGSAADDGRGLTILASAPKPRRADPKPRGRAVAAVSPAAGSAADPVPDVVANDDLGPAGGADAASEHATTDDDTIPAIRPGATGAGPTAGDQDEGPA